MKKKNLNINFFSKIKSLIFPFYKSKEASKIFRILETGEDNKKVAMFVGGCVRKYLKSEEIDDIDIATVFSPDQLKEKFKNSDIKVVDSGIKHGTITVNINNKKFELTTLRIDINPDGRHTDVSFTDNWKIDSERRDFTINSIYLDRRGKIYDPQMGVRDLENGVIKFIGDPSKRIEEDFLRIIRFIRFSLQYNFNKHEKSTIEAIKLNLNGIHKISKERILQEIIKILELKNFQEITNNEQIQKIFQIIFPEFKYLWRIKKIKLLDKKKLFSLQPSFLLSLLLVDKSNNYEYFVHRYKPSNFIKAKINLFADNFIHITTDRNFFKKDLKKNVYFYGKEIMKDFIRFLFLENIKMKEKEMDEIMLKIHEMKIPKFPFDGNFLKKRGFVEGKNIGNVLKDLEDEWVKNNYHLSDSNVKNILERFK